MRKKSQFWDLKTIILLLVIFVVLFMLTNQIVSFFIKSGSSQVCLLSVIAKSKTRGSPTEVLSLECYTNFVDDIKAKGITDTQKKDYLMREIADLSHECWMQFGEGNYDVFSGKITAKTAHCFICSKFNVDKEIKKADFLQFLKKSHMRGTKKSYYDFLYNGFLWENVENKDDKDIVKTGDPVIFVEKMKFNPLQKTGILGTITSYLGAAVTFNFDALMDYLFSTTNVNEFNELEPNNPYATVYFQISDEYWKQMWITELVSYAAGKGIEAVAGVEVYENKAPPARFLITKYENVKDLGCEMLQG